MAYTPYSKAKRPKDVRMGSILIAQPFWDDEKYKRAVILILETGVDGSKGIILNKHSTLMIREALPELNIPLPLFYGGPFNPEIISFLHADVNFPESFHLGHGIQFDGSYDYLLNEIQQQLMPLNKIRFYSGFVQWKSGQLEAELAENKWWTSTIGASGLFSINAEKLWVDQHLMNGSSYGLLQDLPDPLMN